MIRKDDKLSIKARNNRRHMMIALACLEGLRAHIIAMLHMMNFVAQNWDLFQEKSHQKVRLVYDNERS